MRPWRIYEHEEGAGYRHGVMLCLTRRLRERQLQRRTTCARTTHSVWASRPGTYGRAWRWAHPQRAFLTRPGAPACGPLTAAPRCRRRMPTRAAWVSLLCTVPAGCHSSASQAQVTVLQDPVPFAWLLMCVLVTAQRDLRPACAPARQNRPRWRARLPCWPPQRPPRRRRSPCRRRFRSSPCQQLRRARCLAQASLLQVRLAVPCACSALHVPCALFLRACSGR